MNTQRTPLVTIEMATELSANDISELCDATEEAIEAGGGFGWLAPPPRSVLEDYWRGILLVPDYHLFLGKLDQVYPKIDDNLVPAKYRANNLLKPSEGAVPTSQNHRQPQ